MLTSATTNDYETRFRGIERLTGSAGQQRLRRAHVAVVGIGGVGSWAAEALARSGVGALTLIDLDEVCLSNINRQLPALTRTVGQPKVKVAMERALEINPECRVNAVQEYFTANNAEELLRPGFNCVIDAIDAVGSKCLLLARCREKGIPVLTTGAAGGRLDPTKVQVTDLTLCSHDRLLQRVRKVLRTDYGFPRTGKRFGIEAVYAPEARSPAPIGSESIRCEPHGNCNSGYGSATFVTGTFGFVAAARAVQLLLENRPK